MVKCKLRNRCANTNNTGRQLDFLPYVTLFWSQEISCLGIGWLHLCLEIWWGDTFELT